MSHDDRVANGLLLLEALAAAPGMRVPRDRAQALLGCSDAELESYAALLSTLADREGGGRAIVTVDDREVALQGETRDLVSRYGSTWARASRSRTSWAR